MNIVKASGVDTTKEEVKSHGNNCSSPSPSQRCVSRQVAMIRVWEDESEAEGEGGGDSSMRTPLEDPAADP
jgi:hypothetical protein